VIPVLLVFLGLIVFTYKSYNVKLDIQTRSRASALYYASHNCEGSVSTNVSDAQVTQAASTSGGQVKVGSNSDLIGGDADPGATAEANDTVSGSAFVNGTTSPLSREVKGWSAVACNIKPTDSPFSDFIKSIWNSI
jgi:hypothetical protein